MDEQTPVDSPSAESVEQPVDPLMEVVKSMGFIDTDEQPVDDPEAETEQDLEAETDEPESETDDLDAVDEIEADPDEAPDLDTIRITVGDEELSVEDLKSGYLRQSDYTKKTQQIAEQRKEVEQSKEQYATALAYITQVTRQGLSQFDGVDWQDLQLKDPAKYQQLSAQYSQVAGQVQQFETAQNQFLEQAKSQAEQQFRLQAQQSIETLKTLVPEWGNDLYGELREFAGTYGMTAEEFNAIADHRPMLMMLDALKFKKSRDVASEKKAKPPQSQRRTKAQNLNQTQEARSQKAKIDQLRKSRNVKDAAAVLQGDIEKLLSS